MLQHDLSLTYSGSDSVLAFHEVCRSVLNPGSLSFVAANAPWEVVHSFEVRQQRLASFALQLARTMLMRRLRTTGRNRFDWSLLLLFQSFPAKIKHILLLVACTLGRLALEVMTVARHGILCHLQISLSVNILRNVGNVLIDSEIGDDTNLERLSSANVIRSNARYVKYPVESGDGEVALDILRALTVSLPNDLSRLIFLATLRDNNSGHYFHPDLARRFSERVADRAMLTCHQRIYKQVVALPIEDLTDQLDQYVRTVPAPRERMIESWTKLKAYRATVPMNTDPISAEIFFMKVEVAVAILEARLPCSIQ